MTTFELIESPPDEEGVTHYSVAASPALQAEEAGDDIPRSPGGRPELPPIPSNEPNSSTETNLMFDEEIKTASPEDDGAPAIFHDSGKSAALRPPLRLVASRDEHPDPPAAPPEKDTADGVGTVEKAKRKASRQTKVAAPVDPLLVAARAQVDELGRLGREVLSTWNRGHRNLYETIGLVVKVYEDNIGNEKHLATALRGAIVKPAKSGESAVNKILLPIFQAAFGVGRKVQGVESSVERTNLAKKTSDYALAAAEAIAGGVNSTDLADFLAGPGNGIDKLARAHRTRLRALATPEKRRVRKSVPAVIISDMERLGFAEVDGVDSLGDGTLVLVAVRSGSGRIEIKHVVADEALAQRLVRPPVTSPAVSPEA